MTTETTTPQQGEVATGITEDQAASALMERWGAKEPAAKQEPPSPEAEEPEDDTTPEADEATPDDETDAETDADESGDIEIDVAGEKFKVPAALKEQAERIQAKAKEVEAGATRKFQEAADQRKAVEARAQQVEALQQLAHQNADLLADHKWVTKRLEAYEQMDVSRLAAENPAELTRINAEYNQLNAAKQRIEATYREKAGEVDKLTKQLRMDRLKAADEYAAKVVKDWTAGRGEKMLQYALKAGYSQDSLADHLSPEFIKLLDDAEYGARVRGAKPQKSAEPQKTLKPGATAATKTSAAAKADQAIQRARKTGRVEDAAMALLARSSSRKR